MRLLAQCAEQLAGFQFANEVRFEVPQENPSDGGYVRVSYHQFGLNNYRHPRIG
jgi:hypothetical protein